jgi:4-coumarate--CoA ligase
VTNLLTVCHIIGAYQIRGLQVAPAELEAALIEHDDVADAAVVGITLGDDEWPWAYIVLKEHSKHKQKEKTIQAWMRGRLARHKWLEGGAVFVDEVPRLASGKIKRKVMKEWAKRDAEAIDDRAKASL